MEAKLVIIINGKGGVGKDAFCDFVAQKYRTVNISTITPIKEIAAHYGWTGAKDRKSRKFLADLKKTFTDYNDLPNTYAFQEYRKFLTGDAQILFVHIRECEQIQAFKSRVEQELGQSACPPVAVVSLLIRRNGQGFPQSAYGNAADDDVENLNYDYCYNNDGTLDDMKRGAIALIKQIMSQNK